MIPNMVHYLVIILLIYVLLIFVMKRVVVELIIHHASNKSVILNTSNQYMKFNKTDKLNSFLVSVMKNTHNNISLVCLQQNNLSS